MTWPNDEAASLFRTLDREVWIVTAADGDQRGGLVATFVSQASIVRECPRVIVGIAKQHATWSLIEASQHFVLNLLREDQQELVWRFGLRSAHDPDVSKFADLQPGLNRKRCPILTGTVGWLECSVESAWDSGDRTVYLAEVAAAVHRDAEAKPLRMSQLIAGADEDHLTEMKRQMLADAERDALAIAAWREKHRG